MTQASTEFRDERITLLLDMLAQPQRQYEAAKDDFIVRLNRDPANAFDWSEAVMWSAARASIHNQYRLVVTDLSAEIDETTYLTVLAELRKSLTSRVLTEAANPKRSSSPMQNYMAREELSACADLLSTIERMISRLVMN